MAKRNQPYDSSPGLFDGDGGSGEQPPSMKAATPVTSLYALPKDLPNVLANLSDHDFRTISDAVLKENQRRQPPTSAHGGEAIDVQKTARKVSSRVVEEPLTASRMNVIRAAFKAGVKPATIARQFGVSQSAVRKAIETSLRR